MRKQNITFSGRTAILLAFAMLAGCGRQPEAPAPKNLEPKAQAAEPIDKYQAMAFDAGKDLVGHRVPKLTFRTLDGGTVKLGQGRMERPVYLKFWATWCASCREQMPAFKADFDRYGKDMEIVAVNTGVNDDLAAVAAYRREVQLPMPIAMDEGKLGEAFHLKITPQHIIIGRDGTIRYVGHLEDQRLQQELKAAIADQPLAVSDGAAAQAETTSTAGPPKRAGGLMSVQGIQVSLDGPAQGKPRLIYFLSPWCESYFEDDHPKMAQQCRETREALTRLAANGRADVIGIAAGLSTDEGGVKRYLRRTGFQAPIVFDSDGRLFRQFGVRSFPTVIRLDASGHPSGRLSIREIDALSRQPAA